MNLDALLSFVVFSESMNFTRAGLALHISQPALHVKIRNLAESLGVSLYRRVGRRLELTEGGRNVARFGRELGERTSLFLERLQKGPAEHQVVLAAGEGAFLYLLGGGIREFSRRSKLALKLLTADRDAAVEAVQSGKAHLGVASLETTPPSIEAHVLSKVDQVLVLPRRHPLASKREVRLADLEGAKLIVPAADRPHRTMLSRALQSAGVQWQIAVEANGWELMLHFAALGLGWAVVNEFCAIPRGLAARPLKELPRIHYHVFHLVGAAKDGPAERLKKILLGLK